MRKAAIPLLSLRWTSRAKRACVVSTDAEPDRLAPLTPASADRPPRGLGGGGALLREPSGALVAPTLLRGVLHVQAQTCAHAVRRGLHPRSVRRWAAAVSPRGQANSKQAASTAVQTERRYHSQRHALHRWQPHAVRAFLAAVVRKRLGLRLESEKTDGERVHSVLVSMSDPEMNLVPGLDNGRNKCGEIVGPWRSAVTL
jgi:hypothetical protein